MGRPRKTIKEKKLKGTYRKDQDRKPTLITGLGLDTTPPQFLSKMQALEWQTLLSVLDERILIEADKTMLSMLAISIHEFKRQSIALSKEGMTMQGGTKQNPKVKFVEKARKDILELSAHFGLSPKTRANIELPEQPKKLSELDKIIMMK